MRIKEQKPTRPLLERGVWIAPWFGPQGEQIIVAVRRDGRKVEERLVAPNFNPVWIADELWTMLDQVDPEPVLRLV